MVTTLLVARAFVLGNDPGMTLETTQPYGLLIPLLWLVTAAAWAGWRLWAHHSAWYGSWIQVALFVLVGSLFVSAELAASYPFSARLIAWEWLGLFVMFCLIRQMTITTEERQGLFNVLLATGVALAAYGLYQSQVEFPRIQPGLEAKVAELDANNALDAEADLQREKLLHIRQGHVFGTFSHPDGYSLILLLLLPALCFAIGLSRKQGTNLGLPLGVGLCALCVGVALYLGERDSIRLGLVAVVCLFVVVLRWKFLVGRPWLGVALAVVSILGIAFLFVPEPIESDGTGRSFFASRMVDWQTTWALISDHPWWGVGAGNFSRSYPRYVQPGSDVISDPHNLFLQAWVVGGILAFLASLFVVGYFFFLVVRGICIPNEVEPELPEEASAKEPWNTLVRWEFYVGGMLGLLFGFVLHILEHRTEIDNVVQEGLVAGGRSFIWFGAYALLDRVQWTDRSRALALTVGIAAVVVNLMVTGAVYDPAVSCLLLATMALTLKCVALRPVAWLGRVKMLAMGLPLPILTGVMMVYYFIVYAPVADSVELVRIAESRGRFFLEDQRRAPKDRKIDLPHRPSYGQKNPRIDYIRKQILARLERAAQLSPGDARIQRRLAWWNRYAWALGPVDANYSETAIRKAYAAQELDPNDVEGYLAEYEVRKGNAEMWESRQVRVIGQLLGAAFPLAAEQMQHEEAPDRLLHSETRTQYSYAAEALAKYIERDPTNPRFWFLYAQTVYLAGNNAQGRKAAETALELNRQNRFTMRTLADRQRLLLEKWTKVKSASPPLRDEP